MDVVTTNKWIGVAISVTGNILISGSLNVQKCVADVATFWYLHSCVDMRTTGLPGKERKFLSFGVRGGGTDMNLPLDFISYLGLGLG